MQFTLAYFRQDALHWLRCTVIAVILWRGVAFVLKHTLAFPSQLTGNLLEIKSGHNQLEFSVLVQLIQLWIWQKASHLLCKFPYILPSSVVLTVEIMSVLCLSVCWRTRVYLSYTHRLRRTQRFWCLPKAWNLLSNISLPCPMASVVCLCTRVISRAAALWRDPINPNTCSRISGSVLPGPQQSQGTAGQLYVEGGRWEQRQTKRGMDSFTPLSFCPVAPQKTNARSALRLFSSVIFS